MKEIFIPSYPCMYDYKKACVECFSLSGNIENLRKLIRLRPVISTFNRAGIDKPTIQNICDLLFNLDNKQGLIYSDALESLIPIAPELRSLGRVIAYLRKDSIIKISNIPELETKCPNLK